MTIRTSDEGSGTALGDETEIVIRFGPDPAEYVSMFLRVIAAPEIVAPSNANSLLLPLSVVGIGLPFISRSENVNRSGVPLTKLVVRSTSNVIAEEPGVNT